jgi:hypothetical protein
MIIVLPKRLSYGELERLLNDHATDLEAGGEWTFDWRSTTWASLPELSTILCWSAKLVHLKGKVKWIFPQLGLRPPESDDNRFRAEVALGRHRIAEVSSELQEIRTKALRGQMFPRQRRAAIERVRASACGNYDLPAVSRWIDGEDDALCGLDLLGYLRRYRFLERASDAGIICEPSWSSLPYSPYDKTEDSPCLEFWPLTSMLDTDAIVTALADPSELSRIFGQYAHMDVVRRGALGHVLVSELGRNIAEHAHASGVGSVPVFSLRAS